MQVYEKKVEIRWADLDPNFHLRHSAYYDYGAFLRFSYFHEFGITQQVLTDHHFGPIIFREECIFRKELKMGDNILINLELTKARQDFSRWTIVHQLKKDDQLAALITLDGAWIDTQIRKLTGLPLAFKPIFEKMPRSENFEWNVK
ncbi:MAG TPA: thioesterase family protein [Chitinophagaceae bacterium]|nr:thioesterase family protein [Chitinophagaceae bacterium]